MSARSLGVVSIVIGWIVMALILYFLFVGSPAIYLPTAVIGIGSIVATLFVVVGIAGTHQSG